MMDPEIQRKQLTRNFSCLEPNLNAEPNFFDSKCGLTPFLFEKNTGHDTIFASSSGFDRNTGLQVVPSFDDEVFAESLSQIDFEQQRCIHKGLGDINSLTEEKHRERQESLTRLPEEEELNKVRKTGLNFESKEEDNVATSERRQSDTDSLDVYLKPCVITPTKVEDLYSTLEGEDSTVFQFPEQEGQSSELSNGQLSHGDQNDSNIFRAQLSQFCNMNPYGVLNIESSYVDNLNPYHSNITPGEKSYCPTLSHRRLRTHTETEIQDDDEKANKSLFSNKTELQESCNSLESRSSSFSFFPPFLLDLPANQRIFPPKATGDKQEDFPKTTSTRDIPSTLEKSQQNFEIEIRGCSSLEKKQNIIAMEMTSNKGHEIRIENDTVYEEGRTIPLLANDKQPIKVIEDLAKATKLEYSSKESDLITTKNIHDEGDLTSKTNRAGKKVDSDLRINHNDTEKQRRDQMKSRFESLRKVIPKIETVEKTPKIQILKHAWKYIRCLEEEEERLEKIKRTEKESNLRLLKKLQNTVKILKGFTVRNALH